MMRRAMLFFSALFALAAEVSADQFAHLYETIALCTTVWDREYCHVTEDNAILVVFNYEDEAGRILTVHAENTEYIPLGDLQKSTNSKGVKVQANSYINTKTKERAEVLHSEDNLWFSKFWNGSAFCSTVKFWPYDKKSFAQTYKYSEIDTRAGIKKLIAKCKEGTSK